MASVGRFRQRDSRVEESIDYLRTDENWVKNVAIGSALALLSVLFVPALLLPGYYVRVLRAAVDREAGLPTFDSAKAFLVAVVCLLVPGVILGVTVWVATAAGTNSGPCCSVEPAPSPDCSHSVSCSPVAW